MEERHEIIEFPRNLSMKIYMHRLGDVTLHWHRSLELLLLLEGTVHASVDGKSFNMSVGDILLINSNSLHELNSPAGAVFVALQLKPELFKINNSYTDETTFICNSALDEHPERFAGLRMCISRMLLGGIRKHSAADYRNYGLTYWMLAELMSRFRLPNNNSTRNQQKYSQRLIAIVDYIEQHYSENFSLTDLAESQNLSAPYLSNFFNKYIGVKFSQYYTDIKLSHAFHDLMNTDHSVERIAAANGFPEPHAFIRAFKAKFGDTPNAYRKKERERKLDINRQDNLNHLSLDPSNYLPQLLEYDESIRLSDEYPAEKMNDIVFVPTVEVNDVCHRLRHTFKQVITVGRARDLLNHNIRTMLQDIQSTVGYKYIKFHGILSDDMMVCMRLPDGSLQFHYQMVDSALEFLLSIGLKPVVQLSFMPTALASDLSKTVFSNPFNTSPPKDMAEWNLLISDFTKHLITQFGKDEITTWLFCVWCEPDSPAKMFGFEDFSLFCEFYRNTYETVKTVCADISFGSPGFFHLLQWGEPVFLSDFIRYTLSHNCRPDFLNIHYYSDILSRESNEAILLRASSSQMPRETDGFAEFISYIRRFFDSMGVGDLPVYMTEWNLTFSHRNLINDTCFHSCYILKNLLENYDRLESFGYWSLTDLIEENPLPGSKHIFHGGMGIYTVNGVRKNVFYAFDFANRLGDELLAQGDGYFVTRRNDHIQIITYNYIHYGDIFASGSDAGITETERYAPFDMSRTISFSIPLSGLSDGPYLIKEYFVNRRHGSAFDLWVDFGGLPLSSADQKLLQNSCVPGFHTEIMECRNGTLTYSPTLLPLEIRFAEIIPNSG